MTVAVKISLSKPMSVLDSGYCPPPSSRLHIKSKKYCFLVLKALVSIQIKTMVA